MVDGQRNGQEYLVGSSVGGSNGDFAFKWIPSHDRRGVSAAADDAARRDERRILHGTPRLCLVWAVIVVYALLRRMWRQLGRQYASVHKARRRKVAGAGTILAASGLCGQRAGGVNMRWMVAACTMGSMSSGVILWLSLCGVLATQRNARFWVTVTSLALGTCNRSVTNANECCSCNSGTFDSVAGGRNTLRWWHIVATPTTSAHMDRFWRWTAARRHAGRQQRGRDAGRAGRWDGTRWTVWWNDGRGANPQHGRGDNEHRVGRRRALAPVATDGAWAEQLPRPTCEEVGVVDGAGRRAAHGNRRAPGR